MIEISLNATSIIEKIKSLQLTGKERARLLNRIGYFVYHCALLNTKNQRDVDGVPFTPRKITKKVGGGERYLRKWFWMKQKGGIYKRLPVTLPPSLLNWIVKNHKRARSMGVWADSSGVSIGYKSGVSAHIARLQNFGGWEQTTIMKYPHPEQNKDVSRMRGRPPTFKGGVKRCTPSQARMLAMLGLRKFGRLMSIEEIYQNSTRDFAHKTIDELKSRRIAMKKEKGCLIPRRQFFGINQVQFEQIVDIAISLMNEKMIKKKQYQSIASTLTSAQGA